MQALETIVLFEAFPMEAGGSVKTKSLLRRVTAY